MNLAGASIKWVMLVSGALTCTMAYAAIQPQAALQANFGQTLEGPAAEIVVRNWGLLITLVGAMLIHGAFNPPERPMVLLVAGASKLAFIGLVLMQGEAMLAHQAGVAVAVDSVWVLLFAWYLLTGRAAAP